MRFPWLGAMCNEDAWRHIIRVTRPALLLAPTTFLGGVHERLAAFGVQDAIARHDSVAIFDWILPLVGYQGISDRAAVGFAAKHGNLRWDDIDAVLADRPSCPRLQHYWVFSGCGYRKSAGTCSELRHLSWCPLPLHPLRKGILNQAAYSLYLFVRDVCGGDLVGWIDSRLEAADPGLGVQGRAATMRGSLLGPLANVQGVGLKLWSMILADLLLGGDPQRERWVTTGASFVAVDTIVHALLHRTGALSRLDASHPYGPACYAPGGCADVIAGLAAWVDAREFNRSFPADFPRFVEMALWHFAAARGLGICNGNRVDDRSRCTQRYCPAFPACDRVAYRPEI